MRKSQRYPEPDKGRPERQSPGYGNSGYNDLEPPVRSYNTEPPRRPYNQERPRPNQNNGEPRKPEYGARGPVQQKRTAQPPPPKYDLDLFEERQQAKRSSYTGYDLNAFSADRNQRPARPDAAGRQPQAASRASKSPSRSYDGRGEPQRRSARQAPPPAGRNIASRGDRPPARTTAGAGQQQQPYRNREEQRRAQNQRRAKRLKRRRAIVGAFLAVVLVIVSVVLCLTVFFKVNEIKIEGTNLYTSEQVLAMLNFKQGDNMLLIPRKEQADTLPNKMPYVKKAVIKLALPSTVVVTIEDAVPQYYYPAEDGTFAYLDDTLKVLSMNEAAVPEVENPISMEGTAFKKLEVGQKAVFEDEKIQAAMEEMLKALKEVKIDKVTGIMAINQATNFVIYDSRITIKLGEASDVAEKLSRAYASIEKMGQTDLKGTMDVTVGKYAYFTEATE